MKKLIIALGAVVCAASIQAASLNWSITQVQATSEGGSDLTTYTALLYFSAGSGTVGGTLTTVTKDNVIASLDGSSVLSGYVISKSLSSSGAVGGATNASSSFGSGDSVTGFAVILDGTVDSYSNYIVTDDVPISWTSSTGSKMMAFGSQASATWTAAAVPEPTSGLLMLLGVAGLALRRRRA